jgi:hypothetical protein
LIILPTRLRRRTPEYSSTFFYEDPQRVETGIDPPITFSGFDNSSDPGEEKNAGVFFDFFCEDHQKMKAGI